MTKSTPKTYVVFRGRKPGVYQTWPECQAETTGYPNNNYQSYRSKSAAESAWKDFVAMISRSWLAHERVEESVLDKESRHDGQFASSREHTRWGPPTREGESDQLDYSNSTFISAPRPRMPGDWPEDETSDTSFDALTPYRSRYFPPPPGLGYGPLNLRRSVSSPVPYAIHLPTDLSNQESGFFFDPPLAPKITPRMKRPASFLDEKEELDRGDVWDELIWKKIKQEPSYPGDSGESKSLVGVTSAEDITPPNKLQRKERDLRDVEDPDEQAVELSGEQNEVLKLALRRENIFLTGAAGSGKTVTLKQIMKELEKSQKVIEVIAPTGIAALPLGGRTTFSFAGWTPDDLKQDLDSLLARTKSRVATSILKLDVLIIEEISMLENQFLERLNLLFQRVMHIDAESKGRPVVKLPFGGKQVIFLGDFHQLPPVKPFENCLQCGEPIPAKQGQDPLCISDHCFELPDQVYFKEGDKWAFRAPVWRELGLRHVQLQQIHRQKDSRFQDILNKIRNGIVLEPAEWMELERSKELPKGVFAVRLMSRLADVERFNRNQLAAIKFQPNHWAHLDRCMKLIAKIGYGKQRQDPQIKEHLMTLKNHRFPDDLVLKVGAKVVLLYNLNFEDGLVNGSQGTVVGFAEASKNEINIHMMTGSHKSWRLESIKTFREANMRRPIVRFNNGRQIPIPVISSDSLRGGTKSHDQYVVCRTQIPLTLAWALSIHKSQGMTLDYVEVSSKDIFETGQLYVALSRARELEGLNVTGFSREQLPMDKNVIEFYKTTRWENLKPGQRKVGEP